MLKYLHGKKWPPPLAGSRRKREKFMKKNKDDKENSLGRSPAMGETGLKSQTKHGIMAIVFFVLALFFLMSVFDITGVAGVYIKDFFKSVLGNVGYFLLPTLLILLGYSYVKIKTPNIGWRSAISATMFLLSSLGIVDMAGGEKFGGLLGKILSKPLVSLFDIYASIIFLGAILIISILVIFDEKIEFILF